MINGYKLCARQVSETNPRWDRGNQRQTKELAFWSQKIYVNNITSTDPTLQKKNYLPFTNATNLIYIAF